MAGFNRTTRIAGPCKITYGGVDIYSKGDVELRMGYETFNVDVDGLGRASRRISDRVAEISFTPDGRWSNTKGAKSVLFPGGIVNSVDTTKLPGQSWLGATDKPLVITPFDGEASGTLTFHNAVITQIPSLIFSAVATLIGPVTLRAININSAEWSAAASFVTQSTVAALTAHDFAAADIITKGYKLFWTGKTGFVNSAVGIDTMDGIMVDFNLELEPVVPDAYGLVDFSFVQLDVTCRAKPLGVSANHILTALGYDDTGAARGKALEASAADIVIHDLAGDSTTPTMTLNSMHFADAGAALAYGSRSNRTQELTWVSNRELGGTATAATLTAPFVIV